MSFFDWFSAGPEAATKVLDAGIKGIDAIVFTDEEKSQARQQLLTTWVDLQKSLGEETSIRGITRRVIAFAAFFSYVGLVLIAAVLYHTYPDYSQFLMDCADGKFGWMVLTIIGFYFGPMLGRIPALGGKN